MTNTSNIPLRLLAGSCRSGTTWLLDVLCNANHKRAVFEPLHPQSWRMARGFAHKYANAEHDWPELVEFWHCIERAQYSTIWCDYRVRPDRLLPRVAHFKSLSAIKSYLAHGRRLWINRKQYDRALFSSESIVKVIRANLMLPWLATHTSASIAYVLRHPAAVVESQLRLGGDWNAKKLAGLYANDSRLNERLGVSWQKLIASAQTDAALFTMIWCLENILPLQDTLKMSNVTLVYYEHLALREPDQWERLLNSLQLTNRPTESALLNPSQQASEALARDQIGPDQLARCLERLKPSDRNEIQKVLDLFGFTIYHTDSILPEVSARSKVVPQCWASFSRGSA